MVSKKVDEDRARMIERNEEVDRRLKGFDGTLEAYVSVFMIIFAIECAAGQLSE